jgi:hypothetical protein
MGVKSSTTLWRRATIQKGGTSKRILTVISSAPAEPARRPRSLTASRKRSLRFDVKRFFRQAIQYVQVRGCSLAIGAAVDFAESGRGEQGLEQGKVVLIAAGEQIAARRWIEEVA